MSSKKYQTVYISGPMKGYPELNYPLFNKVKARLEASGYTVLSPADNVVDETKFVDDALYNEYMRLALKQLLDCECCILLPGHEESKGSTYERITATTCGIPVCEIGLIDSTMDTPLILPWDKEAIEIRVGAE